MNPPALSYVILYVDDVAASLAFYEKAFGLTRRFFTTTTARLTAKWRPAQRASPLPASRWPGNI